MLQSQVGLKWSSYGVRVKGNSLDAQFTFIRVLGSNERSSKFDDHDQPITTQLKSVNRTDHNLP